jgi:hypothetical protein
MLLNILPRVPLTARTDSGSIQVYCWIFCPGYRWLLVQTQTLFRYVAEYSAPGTVNCSHRRRLHSGILLIILPQVPLTARTDAGSIQVHCWIFCLGYRWLLVQTQDPFRYIAEYSALGPVDCLYRSRLHSGIFWIFGPGYLWLLSQTQTRFWYIAEYSAPGTVDCSYGRRLHSGILLNILPRVPLTARTDARSIQVYCWIFCPGSRWLLVQKQTPFRYILNIRPRVPLTAIADADSILVYCWIFCPGYRWLLAQKQTLFNFCQYSANILVKN